MRKSILLLSLIGIFPSFVFAQAKTKTKGKTETNVEKNEEKPLMANAVDSLSYAMGVNVGLFLKMQGVDKMNAQVLTKALNDALEGKQLLLDENSAYMTIQEKLEAYKSKKVNAEKERGRVFLAGNKKQPGVTELPNGIQYTIIKQGEGIKPKVQDTIKVHYRGTTIDGEIFDESYKRGEPIEFPLENLIEGWKQTLVLMPVGSKWKIFLPSDYGYGDNGQGPKIPGGATLIFELELLGVKPTKAN
jgi:FKBP-type peptidyl-prolyl cis-trans isomerase FklB